MIDRETLLDLAMDCCENDNSEGVCRACGDIADCVEPDARRYKCEACGAKQVFGASELVMMLAH